MRLPAITFDSMKAFDFVKRPLQIGRREDVNRSAAFSNFAAAQRRFGLKSVQVHMKDILYSAVLWL
jgi:hypothetical protein